MAKQAAERVVAGHPIRQLEEAAQERLFRPGEQRHVHRALPAAQHRAQSNHQQLMEIVQPGIAGSWILHAFPAGGKLLPRRPPSV